MKLYFSDVFKVSADEVEKYGALNVSLLSDLPLFIDPFLLFNSEKPEYHTLHDGIIKYLRFLRDKSEHSAIEDGLIQSLYRFSEVRQNWLGFSKSGNKGSGLGRKFAHALHANLKKICRDFGTEGISRGTHLEKLCLIESGVGRDNISDFTTNLIKEYLLNYTQTFAQDFVPADLRREFPIARVRFNYGTETWETARFVLPQVQNDFVLLTPKDMLTRDDTWINRPDFAKDFDDIVDSTSDAQLRAQINNYFSKVLPEDATESQRRQAKWDTIRQIPRLADIYIKYKEDHGEDAVRISAAKVQTSEEMYLRQFGTLANLLSQESSFYEIAGRSYQEAHNRVSFLKDVVENKGGYRIFYVNGLPLRKESDIHILFRLTWFGTALDVSREVNDGRGPVDFKVSMGAKDKSLVEFKLASNPQLERNLAHQTRVYEKASDARQCIKVVFYFTEPELDRVNEILDRLGLIGNPDIVLVDARSDNKPSGSKAASS